MPFLLLIILIAALASGCTSMTRDGSFETVLVRSNPPGASIFVDGEKAGQTPELIEIRRSKSPKIELDTSQGREGYTLPTRYRWKESFFSGFIFAIIYAPIAWTLDLITGTAWSVRESDPIDIKLSSGDLRTPKPPKKPLDAAIAPPRSTSVALSDSAGRELGRALQESFKIKPEIGFTRPYDETLRTFLENDYEYGSRDLNARRRLYRLLNADFVYESYVITEDAGFILKTEIRETRGVSIKPGPELRFNRDEAGPRVFGVSFGLKPWWSRVLPDTIGVDFAEEKINFELGGRTFSMQPVYGDEWWSAMLRYASAINISSTPDRRREYDSRWEISAVPSFRFSRKYVKVTDLPPLQGQFIEAEPEFLRWNVAGGYGLEAGYLLGKHYFYFDLIPMISWSQIAWRQNSQDRVAGKTQISVRSELGYNYTFVSNWLLRAFLRSQAENSELWQDVFRERFSNSIVPATVSNVISGVSIGYRFDVDQYQPAKRSAKQEASSERGK